ncbi:tetratricopeptide repeat protein 16 [Pteropus alecto]|uniref:tetratricopeptide repeat protein 16 n=1 Tax=Pteropus alecto TaxID=9402 RepID=UPI0007689A20|nr:tetratricopeptide repeat protein 16 [Pteropus alecto]
MTDSREVLEEDPLYQTPSQHIPKPWVTPAPKETLQRIFGTSQVFWTTDDIGPEVTGSTVPRKVREYYQQGHQCLEKEDWELAVLFFSRALHLDSQLVDFYALRAEAYIQLCDFSSAVQNLRRAYSFQPENTKYLERLTFVLYLQGQCLFEQCAFQDALNIFLQACELQPEKSCFRYRCMTCLLALKQHRDCLSLVTKEVNRGTTNADVYMLRARLYNFFQKPKLCYQDLHSALLLDPKHAQAKVLLKVMVDQAQKSRQDAGILAVQGKPQHALHCINCAIENNPLDPSLFLFRGTMYRRLREFDAAVEDLLKALDMMTECQEDMVQQAQRQLLLTYNDFAVHCYTQGAYQESVLLLNKVLKDEQQEKGLYINRGDCFFQLGNLIFAEADYQQALELNPQDEGANMRMGLLQEILGFCQQKSKQFQKAESHFSTAIRHNPQGAQYYIHRARCRELMQNIFGARQDVATALLLNPKQPKQLLRLMADLFPGMSVEEILSSQMAQLAKLELSRVVENSLQDSTPRGIMGQLRKWELERQKAQVLQESYKLEQPPFETSEQLDATTQTLQAEPEHPEEAKGPEEEEEEEEKEEKPEPALRKLTSLSDSYLDQTSSGSIFGFRTLSTSETETSTAPQEYRSTSVTTVTFSDSSLLKTQSSDLGNNRDLSLSHGPRKAKAAWGQSQRSSKTEAAQGQSQRSSKTEATQGQSRRSSKTEATQGQSRRSSKTEATQGQSQRSSKTEAMESQSQKPSKTEAIHTPRQKTNKTKATQGPRQRLRKARVAHGRSWGPSKANATQGHSWGLMRSSSKTKTFYDPSWNPSNTEATQGQCQSPKKMEDPQSWTQSMSLGSSETEVTTGLNQNPSQIQADQNPSPGSYTAL